MELEISISLIEKPPERANSSEKNRELLWEPELSENQLEIKPDSPEIESKIA